MRQLRQSIFTLLAFCVIASAMLGMRSESRAVTARAAAKPTITTPARPQPAAIAGPPIARAPMLVPHNAPSAAVATASPPTEVAAPVSPEDQPISAEPRYDSDDVANAHDNHPEQAVWRQTWVNEAQDPAWTERVQAELQQRALADIQGKLAIENLDCRETLCIMHLAFADEVDAETFRRGSSAPGLHYEYQSLDPDRGDGFDDSGYNYELIIKREP